MIKLFDPVADIKEEKIIIETLRSHVWASGSGTNTVDASWNIVGSGSIYVVETNLNGCI